MPTNRTPNPQPRIGSDDGRNLEPRAPGAGEG